VEVQVFDQGLTSNALFGERQKQGIIERRPQIDTVILRQGDFQRLRSIPVLINRKSGILAFRDDAPRLRLGMYLEDNVQFEKMRANRNVRL